MTTTNLIEIFCILDDFCKYFTPELKKNIKLVCLASAIATVRAVSLTAKL